MTGPPHEKIGRYRWLICLLMFVVTVNNYMNRQVFSISAPAISAEFKFSNSDIATIANAFVIAYAVGQLFVGVFIDWIGARIGFSWAVFTWSLTAMATGLSRGVWSFSFFRFLLGASEAANYPGGVKVCAEWFPPKEIATAVGIYQSGSSVGAMIAPVISAVMIGWFGWRLTFLFIAIPGLLWIPFWRHFYSPVESNPKVGEPERQYILSNRVGSGGAEMRTATWRRLLHYKTVWAVALARFCEEPAGWFYFTWLPLYLKNHRSIPLQEVGILLIIPFATFDVGKIGGGWFSSWLLQHGSSLNTARKVVMLGSTVCLMGSIPAAFTATPFGFVLLVSVATFGHGCWATTTQTIPGDIVPPSQVGSVYGITACSGGIGGVLFMQLTGKLADVTGSFTMPLIIAGVLPIVGFAVFSLLAPRLKPIEMPTKREG